MLKKASTSISVALRLKKIFFSLGLILLAAVSVTPRFAVKPQPRASSVHKGSTVLQAPPKPATKPPVIAAAPTPSKPNPPRRKVIKVTTAKPQPAVTPSPAASVTGLAPVAPPGSGTGLGSGSGAGTAVAYTSTNWSGYLTTTGSFTSVSGTWIVPSALGAGSSISADSTWVGIGGVTSGDLVQVGTDNFISSTGQVTTQAWYETLPQASKPINSLVVKAGDSITASVVETTAGVWLVTITDDTTGQSFSINLNYASTHSSAEWVEEDPSSFHGLYPLDNFQTATFTAGRAVASGVTADISASSALPVTMVNKTGQTIALPSPLSGNGFSVTRLGL